MTKKQLLANIAEVIASAKAKELEVLLHHVPGCGTEPTTLAEWREYINDGGPITITIDVHGGIRTRSMGLVS